MKLPFMVLIVSYGVVTPNELLQKSSQLGLKLTFFFFFFAFSSFYKKKNLNPFLSLCFAAIFGSVFINAIYCHVIGF